MANRSRGRLGLLLALVLSAVAVVVLLQCGFEDIPPERVIEPDAWVTDVDKQPINLHLTWQSDPASSLTVQWRTEFKDAADYTPRVWFAPDAPEFVDRSGDEPAITAFGPEHVVEGQGQLYQESLAGEEAAEFVNWTVELTGLAPQTRYCYRAGSWDGFDEQAQTFKGVNLSGLHCFTTAPAPAADAAFRYVVAGDSRGGYEDIAANIERLRALDADFWLFSGDMNGMGNQQEWDAWFAAMAPLVNDTVLMPIQGNHEVFAEVYYHQFALPRAEGLPAGYQEFAWSFDYGNTHFVGLNSNGVEIVRGQVDWLRNDLAAARQNPDIVWTVVQFHHPAYSASNHGSTDRVLEHWVPVLEEQGVDLAFAGHDHNYERSHPVADGQVKPAGQGVVHVVAGAFYSPGYSAGTDWWTVTSTHGNKGNYVVVDVAGDELTVTAYSGDGQEQLDRFSLAK